VGKKGDTNIGFLEVAVGILAILAIGSLFKSDSAKVVSNKGAELLDDEESMKSVDRKLLALKNKHQHSSIEVDI
jgi:hypothetical protein